MSDFSGRCDLADHIMMEKMQPKEDNPYVLISDELECFNIFKQRTGGKIYQNKKLVLKRHNIFDEIKKVNNPDILSYVQIESEVVDKRTKSGTRKQKDYLFYYYGKPYKMDQLKDITYYTTIELQFDTIFDIIPYYPYVISSMGSDQESEYVIIGSKSEVDRVEENSLKYGSSLSSVQYYRKQLQNHYLEVFEKYYK